MRGNGLSDDVLELKMEIRRLRRWMGLMVAGILSVAVMGLAKGEQGLLRVEEVRVKKLVVDDPDANAIAVLSAKSGSPSLSFIQRDGTVRMSLSAGLRSGERDIELAGLTIFDRKGKGMVQVGLWGGTGSAEDAAVCVYDGDRSEAEVRMRVLGGVPSITVRDSKGQDLFASPK